MRKISLLCVFGLFLSSHAFAQVFLKLSNDTLRTYAYAGGDEFNANTVDENNWSLRPWPGTNMGQFFSYETANTKINDGVVVFSLQKKDSVFNLGPEHIDSNFLKRSGLKLDDNKFLMKYSAGIVISKQKYHYGLYELRFKVEEGKGVWPAFWFFGGNANEEIDVFELKGEKNNKIHVDTHCPTGCDRGYKNKLGFSTNWGAWMPVSRYLHEGFNIMLLDWRPGELVWYINGYPLAYFRGDFPNPMNLYLNTQVASAYSAFQPPPDESTPYPNNFYVDYLRIWQSNPGLPVLKGGTKMNASNLFVSDYSNTAERRGGLMYSKKKFNEEQGMISLTLLPANKVAIMVLGDLNRPATGLKLKGQYGTYEIKAGVQNEVTIDRRETELTLELTTRKKIFTQKMAIVR